MIAWTLRDYCRLAGTQTAYIEPGSPWENPFVESFNGRLRDELLNIEEFACLTEAQGHHRGLAHPVQHLPTTLSPRRPHTHRIRSEKRTNTNQTTHRPWLTYRDPFSAAMCQALAMRLHITLDDDLVGQLGTVAWGAGDAALSLRRRFAKHSTMSVAGTTSKRALGRLRCESTSGTPIPLHGYSRSGTTVSAALAEACACCSTRSC